MGAVMEMFVKVLKSVSDKTRIRILKLLLSAGRPLCICEIVDCLGLAQYNISKHVKELKNAGLVSEKRAGRFMYYALIKSPDNFHKHIHAAVGAVSDRETVEDFKKLSKRSSCAIPAKSNNG